MRDDIAQAVKELYEGTCRWQARHGIRVELTLAEYTALWTPYRIEKLGKLLDRGGDALGRYLRHPQNKPVCGWRKREDREGGVLNAGNARIMMAQEQRKLFQFKSGDTHSPETKDKMCKPKTAKARKNMSDGARRRWEDYRASKAAEGASK